jgi:hypothetical protein
MIPVSVRTIAAAAIAHCSHTYYLLYFFLPREMRERRATGTLHRAQGSTKLSVRWMCFRSRYEKRERGPLKSKKKSVMRFSRISANPSSSSSGRPSSTPSSPSFF